MSLLLMSSQLILPHKSSSTIVSTPRHEAITMLSEVKGLNMTIQVAGTVDLLVAAVPETVVLLLWGLQLGERVDGREVECFPVSEERGSVGVGSVAVGPEAVKGRLQVGMSVKVED